jgi:hypothetical protein
VFIRRLVVGVVAVSVLFSAGCRSSKPAKTPNTTPSPPTSATPSVGPSAAAERDALAAYRGMWSAVVEAGKTSDPDAPDLRKYASDQALKLIVSSLYTDRDRQLVSQGELKIDPKVMALTPADAPTEVTVLDCVNDEKWLKYKASGGLVNDVPGGRHRTTATIKRTPDGWKVASFILKEGGTC